MVFYQNNPVKNFAFIQGNVLNTNNDLDFKEYLNIFEKITKEEKFINKNQYGLVLKNNLFNYEAFLDHMSTKVEELLKVIAFHFSSATYYIKVKVDENKLKKICHRGLDRKLLFIKDLYTINDVIFNPNYIGGWFTGNSKDDFINTFSGIKAKIVSDKKLKIELYEDFCNFIFEVWAASNKEYADYILNWFAYRFQNLDKKPQVALIIKSLEGCGKNIITNFICNYIIGEKHSVANLSDVKKLLGNFNSILEDKLLIIANEFTSESSSDKVNKNKLKSNITDEKQVIECKYQNAKVIDDYSAYIFLTNCENPIQIDNNSRRYCIFEASSKYKGKFDFFENFINKFYNEDAANIIYTCLLKRDLSKFNILDFPKTQAFLDIVQLNKPSYEIFIESCKGIILINSKELKDKRRRISAKDLYNLYCEFCIDAGYDIKRKLSNNRFSKFVENLEEFKLIKEHNKIYFELDLTYFKDIEEKEDSFEDF